MTDRLTDWCTDGLVDWLTDGLTDWWTRWTNGRSTVKIFMLIYYTMYKKVTSIFWEIFFKKPAKPFKKNHSPLEKSRISFSIMFQQWGWNTKWQCSNIMLNKLKLLIFLDCLKKYPISKTTSRGPVLFVKDQYCLLRISVS